MAGDSILAGSRRPGRLRQAAPAQPLQEGPVRQSAGRPRGSESLARVAHRILNEKIRVRENGERRTITKLEVMLKQLANKGVSGDLRAIREVLKLPVETGNGEDAGGWRPVVSGEPLSDGMGTALRTQRGR